MKLFNSMPARSNWIVGIVVALLFLVVSSIVSNLFN